MHDITIAPVLSALGAFDNMWPPLASHIAFEVWGPPETAHSGRDLGALLRVSHVPVHL